MFEESVSITPCLKFALFGISHCTNLYWMELLVEVNHTPTFTLDSVRINKHDYVCDICNIKKGLCVCVGVLHICTCVNVILLLWYTCTILCTLCVVHLAVILIWGVLILGSIIKFNVRQL